MRARPRASSKRARPDFRRAAPVAAWLVLCLIWGSTWLFIKLGLADLPPVSFAGLRFVAASAVLWGLVAIRRPPLPKGLRAWGFLALTGFLAFSVNYGLLFWGEERTSSGLDGRPAGHDPGVRPRRRPRPPARQDRMTLAKVSGVALGIAGVAVIFSDRATLAGPDALRGGLAIVGGAFAVALLERPREGAGRLLRPRDPLGRPDDLRPRAARPRGLRAGGQPPRGSGGRRAPCVSLLYLALFGSVVAFLLFYWLLRRMDVTKVLLISLVTPVLAVALGAAVLGERLGAPRPSAAR